MTVLSGDKAENSCLVVPEYPDRYRDIPFSFDQNYKKLIDEKNKTFRLSDEVLKADPVRIQVPGAPESTIHYATDGVVLQEQQPDTLSDPVGELDSGRYYTEIGSAHIEAFFRKGTRDYLYVFTDGARTRNQGRDLAPLPSFLRWTWHEYTSASVLCLEDPMYYTFADLKLGWFHGTAEEDYAEYCAIFIRHMASLLNIPLPHIILYGPSGGGHAVISMSAFIPGCMAVTVNGQYDFTIHDYYTSGEFTRITGLSDKSSDGLVRSHPAEIIREHTENRYLLICNMLSKQDFTEQLQSLCRQLDVIPRYGLWTYDHLTVWLIDAQGAPCTHNTWESPLQIQMIDMLLYNLISGHRSQDFQLYCEIINRYWKERYDHLSKMNILENKLKSMPGPPSPTRLSGLLRRIANKLESNTRSRISG